MDATTERASRRGFLGGLIGGLGVLAATLLRPESVVEAAVGDPVKAGRTTTAGTASTILSTSSTGDGFRMAQAGRGAALVGQAAIASGESIGVKGNAKSTSGLGVRGEATATTGETRGVLGISSSPAGQGVQGWAKAKSGVTLGVLGAVESTDGHGVEGWAKATSGSTRGVYGVSDSPAGYGVQGWARSATGDTIGVYGLAPSPDGIGAEGHATSLTGYTIGVIGTADSTGAYGVVGYADSLTGKTTAVWGLVKSPDGWAGKFTSEFGNGVYISVPAGKAGLNVVAGTKNAVVMTSQGARLLYAEESTEVLFADQGFGRLEDGTAEIALDATFRETIDAPRPYHVFLTPYGDVELWVADRRSDGFTVRGRGAAPDAEFSYRIVGTRAGYAGNRLERAPWADEDENLNPGGNRREGAADASRAVPLAIARRG